MKENLKIIQYKYNYGVYNILDIIKFVEDGVLTQEEFHVITGLNFLGIVKSRNKGTD